MNYVLNLAYKEGIIITEKSLLKKVLKGCLLWPCLIMPTLCQQLWLAKTILGLQIKESTYIKKYWKLLVKAEQQNTFWMISEQ